MSVARKAAAGAAAIVLTLGLAACGADDGTGSSEASGVPAGGGTAEMPSGSDAKVKVTSTGDGPIGLRAEHGTGDVPVDGPGEAGVFEGRLITASGNCLSVTDNDRPDLVVFPEDTEFRFGDERPSVESGDLDPVYVGEEIKFAAVAVPADYVEGIPVECSRGASDTVQVVQGW